MITRLCKESGEILTDQNEILQEQVSFYKTLYSQKTDVEDVENATQAFLENELFPKLTEDEAASCEGIITIEETTNALRKLNNDSAPGNDGIMVEFLKFFW